MSEPIDVLGKGSSCSIVKVRVDKVDVARKQLLSPKESNSFLTEERERHIQELLHEFKLLSDLSHPNIVHPIGQEPSNPYSFLMPIYEADLSGFILNAKPCLLDALTIEEQILSALSYLHTTRHYVHLDLKPSNVLINFKNEILQVALCDFGFASPRTNEQQKGLYMGWDSGKTSKGTPLWMPLERFNYPRLVHWGSDMWAVGLIFWFIFKGEEPWRQYKTLEDFIGDMRLRKLIPQLLTPENKPNCPWTILKKMEMCWDYNFEYRPTASEFLGAIQFELKLLRAPKREENDSSPSPEIFCC